MPAPSPSINLTIDKARAIAPATLRFAPGALVPSSPFLSFIFHLHSTHPHTPAQPHTAAVPLSHILPHKSRYQQKKRCHNNIQAATPQTTKPQPSTQPHEPSTTSAVTATWTSRLSAASRFAAVTAVIAFCTSRGRTVWCSLRRDEASANDRAVLMCVNAREREHGVHGM